MERDLREIWSLKIGNDTDVTDGWTEFEIANKRGTVMIPHAVDVQEHNYDIAVVTEWHGNPDPSNPKCIHCKHCAHRKPEPEPSPDFPRRPANVTNELHLAGVKSKY